MEGNGKFPNNRQVSCFSFSEEAVRKSRTIWYHRPHNKKKLSLFHTGCYRLCDFFAVSPQRPLAIAAAFQPRCCLDRFTCTCCTWWHGETQIWIMLAEFENSNNFLGLGRPHYIFEVMPHGYLSKLTTSTKFTRRYPGFMRLGIVTSLGMINCPRSVVLLLI